MARLRGLYGLGPCLLLATSASAQDLNQILSAGESMGGSIVTRVEEAAGTVTPAPDVSSALSAVLASAASTNDVPLSLFTQGLSLLSSYFPSTTLTAIPSSWPGTIVLGSKTYTLSPSDSPTSSVPSTLSTSTSSHITGASSNAASSQTPSQTRSPVSPTAAAAATTSSKSGSSNGSNDISADKKLGIILGVVLGFIAFAIAGVLFFCLWRRRKDTGSFFVRRTPSTTSSEFRSWRGHGSSSYGNSTMVAAGPFQGNDRYARLDAAPDHERPAMVAAPGLVRHQSSRSNSDENPFYTPQEQSEPYQGLGAGEMRQVNHSYEDPSYQEVANPTRSRRPPSPFNPLAMATMSGGAGTQSEQQRHYVEDHQDRNPFMSPEDEEADDFISPTIPSRHVERRNSPRIHYPSWNEVSEFDFADGRQQEPYHYDGGDGWHPVPQGNSYGRHELP